MHDTATHRRTTTSMWSVLVALLARGFAKTRAFGATPGRTARTATLAAAIGLVVALPVSPAAAGPATPAGGADGGSQVDLVSTHAEARVRWDGRSISDIQFEVEEAEGSRVQADNRALAYAHCRNCRGVAIAFQIVTAGGNPIDLAATNAAVAVNDTCTACQTLAVAYQFVIATPEQVDLSWTTWRRLDAVEHKLNLLRRSTAPMTTIQAETDALAAEVVTILQDVLADHGDSAANRPPATAADGPSGPQVKGQAGRRGIAVHRDAQRHG